MLVASNTSPVCNLAIVGHLNLLRILDERDPRAAAERAGLRFIGVLGVLLRAKTNGQIHAVKPEIDTLRARARFFVSPDLERRVLDLAGE